MRDILFRGKEINQESGDWVYGLLTMNYDERFPDFPAEMCDVYGQSEIKVDYKTVGQYTGLKDKNGNKIFEGDIVKYEFRRKFDEYDMSDAEIIDKIAEVVRFENGRFTPIPMVNSCDDYWYSYGLCNFEVIGNIHDNPELLKGEDYEQ